MSLLNWQENFSVGVKSIDEQHKMIFGMINRLYSAMVDMKENEILEALLSELSDYGNMHFATEEGYFDEFSYPEKETHKIEHTRYKGKIDSFKNKLGEGEELGRELLTFLEDWWVYHVTTNDKKYSSFFIEHGLK